MPFPKRKALTADEEAALHELLEQHLNFKEGSKTSSGGNSAWWCTFCIEDKDEKPMQGSLTRQLAHLLGITGQGVRICKKIPAEVQKELAQAAGLPVPGAPAGEYLSKKSSTCFSAANVYCCQYRSCLDHEICRCNCRPDSQAEDCPGGSRGYGRHRP